MLMITTLLLMKKKLKDTLKKLAVHSFSWIIVLIDVTMRLCRTLAHQWRRSSVIDTSGAAAAAVERR